MFAEGVVEFLPGATGLGGDEFLLRINLNNTVETAHVDDDRVRAGRHVALRIGHAAAAREDRKSLIRSRAHAGGELIHRAGLQHECSDGVAAAGNVAREIFAFRRVFDDMLRPDERAEMLGIFR